MTNDGLRMTNKIVGHGFSLEVATIEMLIRTVERESLMAQLKELKKNLLEIIAVSLKEHGFKKSDQVFHKKTDVGKLFFHLAFINHKDDFDVIADLAIRFDKLEDLIHEGVTSLSEKEKKETASLGVEIGNLTEGRQKRWTVMQESDIKPVAAEIIKKFRTVALPFYDKFSNMETALEVLSGDGRDSWLYSPFDEYRAKAAVGLAFLLGQKRKVEELITAKTVYLEKQREPRLNQFLKFAQLIRKKSSLLD